MNTFTDLRSEALRLFTELGAIAQARETEEALRQVSSAQRRLADGRLTVVVCGEFKRGKSSLLNGLLEEPGLFPVDSYYATSVITMASYAAEEIITVTLDDGSGGLTQREIGRDEIASYATESGNPHNVKKARLITIETPNSRLASGLTVIDTPGVGGIFEEHGAVTLGILPSADVLMFVTDATQSLTSSELAFVAEAARIAEVTNDADGQVFVLTKIDLAENAERIVANTRAKLAAVTGRPADDVEVIPVSARAKLAYLTNHDQDYLEQSNFAEMEQALWASLARRRVKALLGGALADLHAVVRALLVPIDTELAALAQGTDDRTHELTEQTQDRAAWLAALGEPQAAWRGELNNALNGVHRNLLKRGTEEFAELWTRCRQVYLRDEHYLADTDKLVDRMAAEAAALTGSVSELAERSVARVLRDFAKLHGLAIEPPAMGHLPDPPVPFVVIDLSGDLASDEQSARGLRALRQAAEATRPGRKVGASVGSAIGVTVGVLVGAFAGPGAVAAVVAGFGIGRLVGIALGGTFGALTAYKVAAHEVRGEQLQARRELVWVQLQPMRSAQERHFAAALGDLMATFGVAVTAEMANRIARERESTADTLARLAELRSATEDSARERRSELARERVPLDLIRVRVSELATAAARVGSPQ